MPLFILANSALKPQFKYLLFFKGFLILFICTKSIVSSYLFP